MVFTSIEALSASAVRALNSKLVTSALRSTNLVTGSLSWTSGFRMGIDLSYVGHMYTAGAGDAHFRAVIFRFTRLSILVSRINLMGANN